MYFPLVLVVVLIALWLAGGAFYGWMARLYGWFVLLMSFGAIGVAALAVLCIAGPYWKVIYDTLLQPG